ncbi:unnamed protein product [Closterium sp. Naga37s-1]|nr:unnamed protein product [Closterium sp. Naga37s-1]
MADLQRVVTAAMCEERALQANQQFPRASAAPPPVAPPVTAPAAVAHHPPATPAPYPSLLPGDSAPHAAGAAQPFQTFVGPPRAAEVPEATLGQLWRLSEGLRAVHLIQMYGHAGFSRGNSLDNGSRDECLDAADRLAELLAPVLAAPARGGVAGVGKLGTAVRGLRRFSRAGTAADVIGASTAEAWNIGFDEVKVMLLLHEPTNHAEALNEWDGGIVLVSHDIRLINQVAKEIWVCENRTLTRWENDIVGFKNHLRKKANID